MKFPRPLRFHVFLMPVLPCLLGLLGMQGLPAQVIAPSAGPAMQFRTLGADCAPEGLNFRMGSNSIPITIQQGMRSMPYNYSGASPLVFFKLVEGEDGKLVPQTVASVDLSEAGTFPLLVFFKGTKGPDQPVVSVLKEDPKSFPAGTFRIVNDSAVPLNAAFPMGAVSVPPGAIKDYHGKEGGVFAAGITEIDPSGNFLAFNSNVGILPGGRIMFLVLPPASPGGHVQIQRHTDRAPVP